MRKSQEGIGRRIRVELLEPRTLLDGAYVSSLGASGGRSTVPAAVAQWTTMPAGSASTATTLADSSSSALAPAPRVAPSSGQTVSATVASPLLFAGGTTFSVSLSGAGRAVVRSGRGGARVTLVGTDAGTVATIAQTRLTHASRGAPLMLSRLNVRSGAIGSINAPQVNLNGPTSGLNGYVDSITLGSIGPKGTLQLGSANTVTVGNVRGRLFADGNIITLNTGVVTRGVAIDGAVDTLNTSAVLGVLTVGGGVSTLNTGLVNGTIEVGSLGTGTLGDINGKVTIARDATSLTAGLIPGVLTVGGTASTLAASVVTGQVAIGQDLGTASLGGVRLGSGGSIVVGRDVTGAVTIVGDLTMTAGGFVLVGRDLMDLEVIGTITAGTNSSLTLLRNLGKLNVTGNLDTSTGGRVTVGGNLEDLTVVGVIRGHLDRDLVVGLNLGSFKVFGGDPNVGGVFQADIDVTKNIEEVEIRQGLFRSRITVGIAIDGGSSVACNIGPDGPVAVFDSTITAGVSITNLTICGDVVSDLPSNPQGMRTRIVAGVDRAGVYRYGGTIDNFQIQGFLVDAVIAASVVPGPAAGTATQTLATGQGDSGFSTYDAPAGTITGAFPPGGATTLTYPNFTAPPFNSAIDPTIDDTVLPGGSINPSFAPSLAVTPPDFPSKSTVTGNVVSTTNSDQFDHAGIFAADTSGVFVGTLPR